MSKRMESSWREYAEDKNYLDKFISKDTAPYIDFRRYARNLLKPGVIKESSDISGDIDTYFGFLSRLSQKGRPVKTGPFVAGVLADPFFSDALSEENSDDGRLTHQRRIVGLAVEVAVNPGILWYNYVFQKLLLRVSQVYSSQPLSKSEFIKHRESIVKILDFLKKYYTAREVESDVILPIRKKIAALFKEDADAFCANVSERDDPYEDFVEFVRNYGFMPQQDVRVNMREAMKKVVEVLYSREGRQVNLVDDAKDFRPDLKNEDINALIDSLMTGNNTDLVRFMDYIFPPSVLTRLYPDIAKVENMDDIHEGNVQDMIDRTMRSCLLVRGGNTEFLDDYDLCETIVFERMSDRDLLDPESMAVFWRRNEVGISHPMTLSEIKRVRSSMSARAKALATTNVERVYIASRQKKITDAHDAKVEDLEKKLYAILEKRRSEIISILNKNLIVEYSNDLNGLHNSKSLLADVAARISKGSLLAGFTEGLIKELNQSADECIENLKGIEVKSLENQYRDFLKSHEGAEDLDKIHNAQLVYVAALYQQCTGETIPEMYFESADLFEQLIYFNPVADLQASGDALEMHMAFEGPSKVQQKLVPHLVVRMLMDNNSIESEDFKARFYEEAGSYLEVFKEQFYSIFLDGLAFRMVTQYGGVDVDEKTEGSRQRSFIEGEIAVCNYFLTMLEKPENQNETMMLQLLRFILFNEYLSNSKAIFDMNSLRERMKVVYRQLLGNETISPELRSFLSRNFSKIKKTGQKCFEMGMDFKFPLEQGVSVDSKL